jgi:hypothetical protein
MRKATALSLGLIGLLSFGLVAALGGGAPRMKMTTDIPASIQAPDRVETSIGTLRYFDGVPDEATVDSVYDYLDRSRAVEAFLNCIPAMSMLSIRDGQRAAGVDASHKVIIFDTLMDSKSLFLTGNTSTMYAVGFLDLKKDGPTVVDLPSRMLGILDDMAFLYLTDLGMAGPDRGKGGKFLVLPPGHEGAVPDGYHVVKSPTYGVWLFMRGYLDKGVEAASRHIRDNLKVYSLARKDDPPAMEFINGSGREINTVLPNDSSFFEKIHGVVQEEPESFLGPEIKGQLAAIGIEKGKPFAPDDRMKKILIDAAAIGNAAARAISYSPRHPGLYTYGKDSGWYPPDHQRGHHLHAERRPRPRRPGLLPLRIHLRFSRHGHEGRGQGLGLLHGHGGLEGAAARRLEDLPASHAARHPREGLLGADDVRHPDPLPAPDRPAVPHPRQLPRGHEEERRRLHRRLLLAEGAEGSGEQLAADDPGQGLVRRAAHVRPAPALARPDLATRRDRAGGVMFPRITFQES